MLLNLDFLLGLGLGMGLRMGGVALDGVVQLVRDSPHRPRGHMFNFWSGHIAWFRVRSPVGACTRRQQINVSLSH